MRARTVIIKGLVVCDLGVMQILLKKCLIPLIPNSESSFSSPFFYLFLVTLLNAIHIVILLLSCNRTSILLIQLRIWVSVTLDLRSLHWCFHRSYSNNNGGIRSI